MVKTSGSMDWLCEPTEYWNESNKNPFRFVSGPFDSPKYFYYKTSSGQRVPDYWKRKREGRLLPFTPWFQVEITGIRDSAGDWTEQYTYCNTSRDWYRGVMTNGLTAWRFIGADQVWSPLKLWADCQGRIDEAAPYIQAAASKIYSQGWDALTFLAELKETVALFKLKQTSFAKLTRRLSDRIQRKKRYIPTNKDIAEAWDDAWLTSRFGVRTLFYDMQDITKLLANWNEQRTRFIERAGFSESWEETPHNPGTKLLHDGDVTFSGNIHHKLSVRGSVVADIAPPDIALNPVVTAWELVPYSFVVDWFVGVGRWLESLSFLALSHEHYAAGGVSYQRDANYRGDWNRIGSGHCHIGEAYEEVTLWHDATMRIPMSVSLRPYIGLNFDWLKGFDLAALLEQALTRR